MSLLTGKASDFLKIGAGRDDVDSVRAVLNEKPDWIARTGSHGRTMLWEAAYRGRASMVKYLLDRGADIDACGCRFTPLVVHISPYCAARFKRHDDVADRLLQRGARLDVYAAAYLGQLERVREYLDSEPGIAIAEKAQNDPNLRATVFHYAVAAGYPDIVSLLLRRGADPRPYGYFPVRFCIWRDRHDRWTPSTRGASACPWNPRRGCRSWSLRPAGYRWRSPGRRSLQKSFVASMLWGTFRELFPSSVAIICTLTRVNGSKG